MLSVITVAATIGTAFCLGVLTLRSRRDAVALLTLFCVLLMLVPARLVLPGAGGVGTPATVLAIALLGWWLAGRMVGALGFARGYSPVRLGVLAYFLAVLLSYALAPLRLLSDVETSGADRELIALLGLLGVALVAADGIDTQQRLDRLLARVIGLAAVVAVIGMLQFLAQFDLVQYLRPPGLVENSEIFTAKPRSFFARPYSTTLHPIEFAAVLSTVFPLALQRALSRIGEPGQWWRWACTALLAVSTMMAVSRSGILGLAVAGAVLAVGWSWRARLTALVAAVLFLAAVRAAVPGLVGTLRNLFVNAENDPSIQGRLADVDEVRRLLPDHWFAGRGYGTWNSVDYFVLDNEYFRSLLTTGLLGIAALFLLVGLTAAALLRVVRTARGTDRGPLARALLAALAVQVATMATFDGLAYPMFSGLFFLVIGVSGALWRLNDAAAPDGASTQHERVLLANWGRFPARGRDEELAASRSS